MLILARAAWRLVTATVSWALLTLLFLLLHDGSTDWAEACGLARAALFLVVTWRMWREWSVLNRWLLRTSMVLRDEGRQPPPRWELATHGCAAPLIMGVF